MADPDVHITGEGGGGGHSDPEIREGGGLFFFLSVWSKDKGGGGGRAPPLDLSLLAKLQFHVLAVTSWRTYLVFSNF